MNKRVLIIDDDTNLLNGLCRQLHRLFDLETAESGERALALLEVAEPFAVVICDMRMPGLNGVETLRRIRDASPDTVRIMLTGNVDQQTAADAVNDGQIFRFLNKPVSREALLPALDAGIEQHRLITAEKELLSKTLAGSVKVLTDVLSLVNPSAFARTSRVRRLARQLADRLKTERAWEVELAASLSLVGCVALQGTASSEASPENSLASRISHDLIAHIPRLETVAQIVANQDRPLCEIEALNPHTAAPVPVGARILKVALDYDELTEAGSTPRSALNNLKSRHGWYDPKVVEALEDLAGIEVKMALHSVSARAIPENAILAEDLRTTAGRLLLSRGQEISSTLRLRVINYASSGQISEAIKIESPSERRVAN